MVSLKKGGGAEMYWSQPQEGDRDTVVSRLRSLYFTHL